ncbi:calcium-binding protein [uncultured Tateyamaria sp.]|uniref:calcium-binding protein n=1 Tax=uncultured Tateyamaria sp. TaxID=455651 RepID=UPI00260F5C21|nr:calcium-binding protein [uncultured Tateyamaria sp.]
MAYLQYIETSTFGPSEYVSNITDMLVHWVGGVPRVYVTTQAGGVSVLEFGTSLASVDQAWIGASTAGESPRLMAMELDGASVMGYFGQLDSGLSGFALDAAGRLGAQTTAAAPAPVTLSSLEVIDVDGTPIYYAANPDAPGLTIWDVTASGDFSARTTRPFGEDVIGTDTTAFGQVTVSGNTYLLAVERGSNSLASFEVRSSGNLGDADQIDAASGYLPISDPTTMETVNVAGDSFAILGSAGSNSLTVIHVSASGFLSVTDHVIDDRNTRFEGITAMDTVTVGDQVFVIVGGADDGISLLRLLPDGRLLHEHTLADSLTTTLENVSAVTAAYTGGQIEVLVASATESGVTRFAVDPGTVGTTQSTGAGNQSLTGTASADILNSGEGDDTLSGAGGDDIVMDGTGVDRMTGGAGRDTFVLSADGETDYIDDFNINEDEIDLSAFGFLRSMDQLTLTSTGNGINVSYRAEDIVIQSHNGQSISETAFRDLSALELSRFWIQTRPPEILGTSSGDALTGSDDADFIRGAGGNDTLMGNDGDDIIEGGNGSDTIDAGAGNDTVDGGGSDDVISGNLGDDILYGLGGSDLIDGGAGDDSIEGGSGDDTLIDGAGSDTLSGGVNTNTYVLANDGAWDIITDFTVASDVLDLRNYNVISADDIIVTSITGGARLNIGGDILELFTADGATFTNQSLRTDGLLQFGNGPEPLNLLGTPGTDSLIGDAGNDTIDALGGFDTVDGGVGDDLIYGGEGRDSLIGGLGNDEIWAGTWADTVEAGEGTDTVYGGEGDDIIFGGAGNDLLHGGEGRDAISGESGNDTINGDFWADTLSGGEGTDLLNGGQGDDEIHGGNDNDTLNGEHGNDRLHGDAGNDLLVGDVGQDFLYGGAGQDTLLSGSWSDFLYGNDGDDLMDAGTGDDQLWGGLGNDTMYGDDGRDRMYGGAGDDELHGGTWADQLWGDDGNDVLNGGQSNDVLEGGNGNDTLIGEDGADRLFGGAGADLLQGGEERDRLEGGTGHDVLMGDGWSDLLFGDGGNDTIYGGQGNDGLNGGDDHDVLFGGEGQDQLYGGGGNDSLDGGTWADELFGGFGNDTLNGGGGGDRLLGGGGADTFIFAEGRDVILDFDAQNDQLMLDLDLFGGTAPSNAELEGMSSTSNGDLFINFGGFNGLTLEGLTSLDGINIGFDFF